MYILTALNAMKNGNLTSLNLILQEHLRRILRGQASLFDWSRSTSLARTLSPRVLESQIDAKKVCQFVFQSTIYQYSIYFGYIYSVTSHHYALFMFDNTIIQLPTFSFRY